MVRAFVVTRPFFNRIPDAVGHPGVCGRHKQVMAHDATTINAQDHRQLAIAVRHLAVFIEVKHAQR